MSAHHSSKVILFFDVETTFFLDDPSSASPRTNSQEIIEFGSVEVCFDGFYELPGGTYHTLIRPSDQRCITSASVRCNGLAWDDVKDAPTFEQVADRIFRVMDGE